MIEVGIYGIDKDRELVEALLETFDGKNIKVMEEAIIALSSARDQAVRRRLIQLLSTQKDSGVRITLLAALAYKDGPWPIDAEDVESIKAIVLEPTDSIDGDFNLKSTAILALGAIGAVKALEDLQKYEGINQALGPNLDAALRRARDVKKNGPDQ
jgi:HEAT repeat protein